MLRVVSAVAAAGLMAAPVLAQDEICAKPIVALSGLVLEDREELAKLPARKVGADAAYLIIRYAPLSGDAAVEFLNGVLQEDIRGIKDLFFAWTVVDRGFVQAYIALGDADARKAIFGSPSGPRALIARGEEEYMFEAFAELADGESFAPIGTIAAAAIDLPDAMKLRLAARAEELGELFLAGALYATMRDPKPYPDFFARLNDNETAAMIGRQYNHLVAIAGNAAAPPGPTSDPAAWQKIYEVLGASALVPELEFLNTFFNMSGDVESAVQAARALKTAIELGTIAPKGPRDIAWLVLYHTLKSLEPQAPTGQAVDSRLDNLLASISTGRRPERTTTLAAIDWMQAVDVLGPYLRAEADELPEAPPHASETLRAEWPEWQLMAQWVRGTPEMAAESVPRAASMASELLFATGDYARLYAFIEAMPASSTSTALAEDFARRIDRQCAGYLAHPAEAVLLAGTSIYKFDEMSVVEEAESAPPPAAPAGVNRRLRSW